MSDMDEPRWIQRLDNLTSAFGRLDGACRLVEYSDLERAGLIQTFNFTFELTWKVLKDLLAHEGLDARSPRQAIRLGYEAGYIGENGCEILLEVLSDRNTMSHTYRREIAVRVEHLIKKVYHPLFRRILASLEERAARWPAG